MMEKEKIELMIANIRDRLKTFQSVSICEFEKIAPTDRSFQICKKNIFNLHDAVGAEILILEKYLLGENVQESISTFPPTTVATGSSSSTNSNIYITYPANKDSNNLKEKK
jgi:hypothetical protein